MKLGVLENKGRRVRIRSCSLYPHSSSCYMHVHKNIFIALWRCTKLSNITAEYRADFLGIYSLGWLSGLAVTGPHWRATESIKVLKLQKIHFLEEIQYGCWLLGVYVLGIQRVKMPTSTDEPPSCGWATKSYTFFVLWDAKKKKGNLDWGATKPPFLIL